ncbi:hypothetical protein [Lactobacillus acidophilus]|uniref:hypothetical protein n=1 Tax=Lactobacillus acidophilus TaxID=1579 RepID=UPI0021A58DE8|nr:hypothetical protein [Lactobacillus acidophilus]
MSLIRDPVNITSTGRQMMTAGGDITYTKATLYGQDISHLTKDQLESLTSIGNPLLTVPVGISDKSVNGSATTIVLEATFQNSNLKADLPYTAVGFFAKKGDDEKLVLVGVADPGAYLVATPPDGIATDALDIKVAISIGDAASVTAVVDPAGSVTPAALNGAINKLDHDLTAKIDANLESVNEELDTKSDKATVESDLATKANKSDLDKTNAIVETKADKTDVASSVKQLQDSIATKADAKTVNDAISKIDFTSYAKMVDVYSKAELDKKLLALSTDTDGKVNADQVATMIEGKANKTDVDAKIKAVTDLANTKVDASDVYTKKTVDDAFSTRDSNITNAANLAKQASQNIDSTLVNSYFRKQGMDANGNLVEIKSTGVKVNSGGYAFDIWNNDWTASKLKEIINQVASLNSSWQVRSYSNAVNLNDLWTAWGISYLINSNNTNTPSFISDKRGTLFTFSFDGNGKWQLFAGCIKGLAYRSYLNDGDTWHKLADDTDISDLQSKIANAQNTATQANNNANTRLPLTGGAMNSNAEISFNNDAVGKQGGLTWNGSTDSAKIYGDVTAQDNLDLAFDLGDDGSNHFSFRRNGSETSAITSDGHYTGTVDWGHVNGRPQDQINKINTDNPLFRMITNSNNWNDIFGVNNSSNVLTSLRINAGGSGALLNDFAAGIGFGGADTKGVLSVAYQNHQARITGGNGAGPVWSEDVAWKSDINDLRNQVQQLRENQFETQTFTDANAAANWEAQRPGKRMAIVNR